ncbi:MAG: DUF6364 family protein [Thermodesulfobacteriota bacterium]|nr:DUF6364 family protein [Thermodesulfobacteriota bacterium]
MPTKLTLSLNNDIIVNAKAYAKKNHTSLSVLTENYFRFLTEKYIKETKTVSPLVNELSGVIELPDNFDSKKKYTDYLTKKYS